VRRRRLLAWWGLGAVVATLAAVAWWATQDDPRTAAPARASTSTTAAEPTTTTTTIAGAPGAAGVGDPYFPGLGNGGYDVEHYELALDWRPADGSITGLTTIEATATQDLSRFNLDLAGLEVTSVEVDGRPAAHTRTERELEVSPPAPLPAGARFTATIAYGGIPEPVSDGTDLFEVGWQRDGDEAYVVSEPSGAGTFFPVNDHPTDKATYAFEITVPTGQVAATNGLLQGSRDLGDGRTAWTYAARDPMASYLVQIAIGDYELVDGGTVGGVRIRHVLHRSFAQAAKATVSRTAEMLDVLDDVFGPYPFEAYGVVAVDEPLGYALETQTLTIIGRDVGTSGRDADALLLHELAHQWVGNAVSPSTWQDIWLNEGFATYSEWLWSERTGGHTAAAIARSRAASGGLDLPPGAPGNAELFSRSVYLRGGMTLQALREAVGDAAFFEVLRSWVDEHRFDDAATADLIALAERVSGQELDALFDAWLYGDELPALG
jgi:aminopeptidase N